MVTQEVNQYESFSMIQICLHKLHWHVKQNVLIVSKGWVGSTEKWCKSRQTLACTSIYQFSKSVWSPLLMPSAGNQKLQGKGHKKWSQQKYIRIACSLILDSTNSNFNTQKNKNYSTESLRQSFLSFPTHWRTNLLEKTFKVAVNGKCSGYVHYDFIFILFINHSTHCMSCTKWWQIILHFKHM